MYQLNFTFQHYLYIILLNEFNNLSEIKRKRIDYRYVIYTSTVKSAVEISTVTPSKERHVQEYRTSSFVHLLL